MANNTGIEWTDVTDNPVVVSGGGWWCKKISEGCANCYAEKLNQNSFFTGNQKAYSGKPPELILKHELLASWARMRSPKRHFVSSMTDIFGEWVPLEWQLEILDAMSAAPKQTFQLLTKRPGQMAIAVEQWLRIHQLKQLPSNIWVGTSVENQKWADVRIVLLAGIPAAVRFLSVEPLLEEVNLKLALYPAVNWVIIGGESGVNARPCHVDWLRYLVDQCRDPDIPVFVKQLGAKAYWGDRYSPATAIKLSHPKGGDIAEFPLELRVRELPKCH